MTKLRQRKIPKYQLGNKSSYTVSPFDIGAIVDSYMPKTKQFYGKVPYRPLETKGNDYFTGMEAADYTEDTPENYDSFLSTPDGKELSKKEIEALDNEGAINPFVQESDPDYETVSNAQKYKDLLEKRFKAYDQEQLDRLGNEDKKLALLTGAIKPGMALGSAWMNWQQLKKTRDAAKNIKAPRVEAATMPNRPVQDLSPEIISLYLKQIGGLKTKKTSDATANVLGEQMINLSKMGAMDKLAAKRAENLFKERERSHKIKAINAQEAVKAMNEQSKYNVDMYNKKSAIDAAYEGKKQDFINRWVEEALVKPMEKRVAYNLGKEAIEESDRWNRLQTQIVNAQNRWRLEPTNPAYKKALDALLTQQQSMTRRSMPAYGESMSYLFSKK